MNASEATSGINYVHSGQPLRATPLARRMAAMLGLDLNGVPRRGSKDRVRKADVLAWLERRQDLERNPPRLLDQPVAVPALSDAPCVLTVRRVDMGAVAAYQAAQRDAYTRHGLVLTDLACISYVVAAALLAHPRLNAAWSDDGLVLRHRVHLRVPCGVLRDAGDLTLRGVARAMRDLERQPDEGLIDDHHSGATFTLLATIAQWSTRLSLPPGQSALLQAGPSTMQAVALDGAITIRPVLPLALTYDARVMDQAHADAFLEAVQQGLETFMASSVA